MKKIYSALIIIAVIAGITYSAVFIFSPNEEAELVIYTYDSLLADPGFDFDREFEEFVGLSNGSIKVVTFDDVQSIISQVNVEKDNPRADVVIGIDNTFIFQARDLGILEPYQASGVDNLVDGLIEGLADDYLLTPYDYGVISLWYTSELLDASFSPSSFVLEDLLNTSLAKQLIVENPKLSSPGLGFLLSTIAVYGDSNAGVNGVASGSWQKFWGNLSSNTRLAPSWGDAYTLFATPEEGRPMMVSYTSSPAYGACLYDDHSTEALLSNEGGKSNLGWRQIEGLGLVKDAPHERLAKQFIDWFITDEVQGEIYQNQWMYPALQTVEIPSCYAGVPKLDEVTPLNQYIPQDVLETNLDTWLDEWELAWVG